MDTTWQVSNFCFHKSLHPFIRAKQHKEQRTLPAHLACHPYLVYNLSWGKKTTTFLTSPPHMFYHSISTGLIWLIDFEVVLKSFTVQTHFFVETYI